MINRTNIDDRDRHLMKKFRNIIEEKEQRKEQYKQQTSQRRPWLVLITAGVITAASILLISYHMLTEPAQTDTTTPPEKIETAVPQAPASMTEHTSTDVKRPDLADEKPSPELPSETVPVVPPEEMPPPSEVVRISEEPTPVETLPQIVTDTDVTIQELVVCRHIKHRKYVSPENRFSMKNGAELVVWTWMKALTDKPRQDLSHIYYLNDKRFCRIILPVPFRRTRTWSKLVLNKPSHAGSWRVDVVDNNGQVLARADFTVEF